MTDEEYLRKRIEDLENAVIDSSLPMKLRKNQASALLSYRQELQKIISERTELI